MFGLFDGFSSLCCSSFIESESLQFAFSTRNNFVVDMVWSSSLCRISCIITKAHIAIFSLITYIFQILCLPSNSVGWFYMMEMLVSYVTQHISVDVCTNMLCSSCVGVSKSAECCTYYVVYVVYFKGTYNWFVCFCSFLFFFRGQVYFCRRLTRSLSLVDFRCSLKILRWITPNAGKIIWNIKKSINKQIDGVVSC